MQILFIFFPLLSDFNSKAPSISIDILNKNYFSDSLIKNKNLKRHLDIVSRIEGFEANIDIFREIEIIDIRPF